MDTANLRNLLLKYIVDPTEVSAETNRRVNLELRNRRNNKGTV